MNHPSEFQSVCRAATSVIYHKVSLRLTKINCEFLELQLITGSSAVLCDYRYCVSSHEIYIFFYVTTLSASKDCSGSNEVMPVKKKFQDDS